MKKIATEFFCKLTNKEVWDFIFASDLEQFFNIKTRNWYGFRCAEEEIRTPTPGYGRYHLKVVRLPISPPPQGLQI